MTSTSMNKHPSTKNKTFLYLPAGVRAEIEKFRRTHGLPSTSAAARALIRFAAITTKDLDEIDQSAAYLQFVEAAQPVRLVE